MLWSDAGTGACVKADGGDRQGSTRALAHVPFGQGGGRFLGQERCSGLERQGFIGIPKESCEWMLPLSPRGYTEGVGALAKVAQLGEWRSEGRDQGPPSPRSDLGPLLPYTFGQYGQVSGRPPNCPCPLVRCLQSCGFLLGK